MANHLNSHTRRDFLKKSAAASTAIGALSVPRFIHAGVDDTFDFGLIRCRERGSGAAVDAMSADPRVRLVEMGDAFEDCALTSKDRLAPAHYAWTDVLEPPVPIPG